MKIKEYVRLGKISIKSRKKSTRNTVMGICFGLIILIPVLFFSLSFYLGLTSEVNKVKTVSAFHIPSRNMVDESPASVENPKKPYDSFRILDYKSAKSFSKDSSVQESIASEYYEMIGMNRGGGGNLALTVNGDKKVSYVAMPFFNQTNYNRVMPSKLKIIHMPENGKYIFDSELYDLNKKSGATSIFSLGSGFTAKTLGKTEIIVSEDFCNQFFTEIDEKKIPLTPSDLIGKEITLTFAGSSDVQTESIRYKITEGSAPTVGETKVINYLQNFKVVGVINSKYYKLPSSTFDAHVWVSSASVYDDDFMSIAPSIEFMPPESSADPNYNVEGNFDVNYKGSILQYESRAAKEGKMVVAYGALQFSSYISNYGGISQMIRSMTEAENIVYPPLDTKIQCNSYEDGIKLGKKIDAKCVEIAPSQKEYASYLYANTLFSQFKMMNMVGGYIMIVMYAFGGIIFFATMLNLYNSVNYSVQVRKNYMGVMRAIGAKSSMIPKLYFWEILLIFLRALPWVLVISGGVSYGIKALVDMGFKYVADTLGMAITLNFAYFFAALGIVVAIVFVIALAFSQIASAYAARRPILDVLSDDKG